MTATWLIVSALLALLLAWTLVSQWGQERGITGPMVFLGAGIVLAGFGDLSLPAEQARQLAELTLVIVLFHDASTVRLASLRNDPWIAVRLLVIGFPLMLGLTTLAAWWLLPAVGLAGAVLIAACVTPTDAGLGAATILDPAVPVRVRRALNVESGLNDGLATPVALLAIAVIAGEQPADGQLPAVLDIGALPVVGGVVIGLLLGFAGARLLDLSYDRGLSSATTRSLAVVTLPILALGLALLTDSNGFLAAFITGITFGRASQCMEVEESSQETVEVLAELLGFIMWVVAGALVVDVLLDGFRWEWLVLAVAALTVLRAAAVALSLLGTHFRLPTVAFLSWFGPRGLASIVFALLAIEELGADADLVRDVTGVVGLTVLLSVILHGATSGPWARSYGRWVDRTAAPIEMEPSVEPMPSRGRGMPRR
jgi:NhaP-type Na+/H+ or K+/H+ antiporter